MRKDKVKAYELRRAGKSYKEIQGLLGIPLSTLSDWFRNENWSKELKEKLTIEKRPETLRQLKLMAEANRAKWDLWHKQCQAEAAAEFPKLKSDPIFISGLMLYWGEGDKKLQNGLVSLANTDPVMIKLFYLFLTDVLKVPGEKIRLMLILYPDLVESVQKNLWSKLTKIPIEKFRKSSYITGHHPTKRNSYGVCLIRVSSRGLKEKIIKWLELCQVHLLTLHNDKN